MDTIESLRSAIERYNDLYYNEGTSEVEDPVYDSLKLRLRELEGETDDPHSPLNRVGAPLRQGPFKKVNHLVPMLSLDNVFTEDELVGWANALPNPIYVAIEPKLDGASLSLRYVNGKLIHATTRGDGEVGDDVYENAVHISGIPTTLSGVHEGVIEIRGECVIPRATFEKLKAQAEAEGKKTYANPRNMVAGMMRRLDPESLIGAGIVFMAYDCIREHAINGIVHSHMDTLNPEVTQCFTTVDVIGVYRSSSLDAIWEVIEEETRNRHDYAMDIDGLVIKAMDEIDRVALGSRSTAPRWAVAYKFAAETTTSILERVEVQVGRTGVLTPVAKIKPVNLCGVTVSSVTLHNFNEIERLDLRLLDTVIVSRRGDVIPKIEGVVKDLRQDDHGKITAPTECPCCGGEVTEHVVTADGPQVMCLSKDTCPAQAIGRLSHFASRQGINIRDLGPATIEALIAVGSIGSFSSIFMIGEDDLYAAGVGQAMADKILASINAAKREPFFKVLRSVSIPEVGASTAKAIAKVYPSFEALSKASFEQLQEIPDIGPVVALSIMQSFAAMESDLFALDRIMLYPTVEIDSGSIGIQPAVEQDLVGQTFVVTGSKFGDRTRGEMEEHLESRGAKISSSVSKKTTAVYVGTSPGTEKLLKAKSLGTPLVIEF